MGEKTRLVARRPPANGDATRTPLPKPPAGLPARATSLVPPAAPATHTLAAIRVEQRTAGPQPLQRTNGHGPAPAVVVPAPAPAPNYRQLMDTLEDHLATLNGRAERRNYDVPSLAITDRIDALVTQIAEHPDQHNAILTEFTALEQFTAEKLQLADRDDAVRAALKGASDLLTPADAPAQNAIQKADAVEAWRRSYFQVHDTALTNARARLVTFRARVTAVTAGLANVTAARTYERVRIEAGEALVTQQLVGADAGLVATATADGQIVTQAIAACSDNAIDAERTRLARAERDGNNRLMAQTATAITNAGAKKTLTQFTAALAAAVQSQHNPPASRWLLWLGYAVSQQAQHLRVRPLGKIYGVDAHMTIYYNSIVTPDAVGVNQPAQTILDALVLGDGTRDSAHVTLEAFGRISDRNPHRYRAGPVDQNDYTNQADGRAWNAVSQKMSELLNAEVARILVRINDARAVMHV